LAIIVVVFPVVENGILLIASSFISYDVKKQISMCIHFITVIIIIISISSNLGSSDFRSLYHYKQFSVEKGSIGYMRIIERMESENLHFDITNY